MVHESGLCRTSDSVMLKLHEVEAKMTISKSPVTFSIVELWAAAQRIIIVQYGGRAAPNLVCRACGQNAAAAISYSHPKGTSCSRTRKKTPTCRWQTKKLARCPPLFIIASPSNMVSSHKRNSNRVHTSIAISCQPKCRTAKYKWMKQGWSVEHY